MNRMGGNQLPREDLEDEAEEARDAAARHLGALGEVQTALVMAERRTAALARALDALVKAALDRPEVAALLEQTAFASYSFAYIGIGPAQFLSLLMDVDAALREDPDHAIREARYRPVRYLEVGCGPGLNLHLVRSTGILHWAEVRGFDVVEAYVEAGRRAFALGDALFVGDALTAEYGQADVIFSYRPFSDDRTERRFELRVADGMRVGAYLVAPLSMHFASDRRLVAVGESGQVWKKLT